MRQLFAGYYRPTEDELATLWEKAIIILDASVLLAPYRLPAGTRDELLALFNTLREQLWIPYQAAMEYQRNRLTVITQQRKALRELAKEAESIPSRLQHLLSTQHLNDRSATELAEPLRALNEAAAEFGTAAKQLLEAQIDVQEPDPVRERFDTILSGHIGDAYDQERLDALFTSGDMRYALGVPPGWADVSKGKNDHGRYSFDGRVYRSQFGDLVLWEQILDFARSTDAKHVMLVTQDLKEDWWARYEGKTAGPHPELIHEIRRAGVEQFHMYQLPLFMAEARRFMKANVSDSAIREVEESASIARLDHEEDFTPARRWVRVLDRGAWSLEYQIRGRRYRCLVSEEAMSDRLHGDELGEMDALDAHRPTVNRLVSEKVQLGQSGAEGEILLRSEDFARTSAELFLLELEATRQRLANWATASPRNLAALASAGVSRAYHDMLQALGRILFDTATYTDITAWFARFESDVLMRLSDPDAASIRELARPMEFASPHQF